MSKSTLQQLGEYLESTDKQYWASVLQSSIEQIALNVFTDTEDYIDAEAIVFDYGSLATVQSVWFVKGIGDQGIACDFKIYFDLENECDTDKVHHIQLKSLEFVIGGSRFNVTDALREAFLKHMTSTGINFILTN